MANENANHPLPEKDKDDFYTTELDDSKAKFIQNGDDSHVVVEVGSSSEASFNGLGKEELMKYADDPFWVRTRKILFILFWVGWLAMLVAAVLIIVFAPKCPERPNLKWYQKDVIYQVQPKSFLDTTTDKNDAGAGIGDLHGINAKISYFEDIGVNALWINSIYEAGKDSYEGQDVVDHKKVSEILGGMAAFDDLRKNTKKKGMKLILDFIPNYTGKTHQWFNKSETRDADYADYYIWADGKSSTSPPNNWVTADNQPAWTYSNVRKQWYYHSSSLKYPELNLRNETVLAELDGILRFWFEKGVDGFAVQGLQHLVEGNDTLLNENTAGQHTMDQADNLNLVKRWRAIADSFSDKPGRERVLIGMVSGTTNITTEYKNAGIHITISDVLVATSSSCDNTCIVEKLVSATEDSNGWRGWMLDNENTERYATKWNEAKQKAWQVFHLLLPGTPIVYYGDEIAMTNGNVAANQKKDPLGKRDEYRTPMLWSRKENAGFCAADIAPWLPVNADYQSTSVEYNMAHLLPYSTLESFQDLVNLRKKEAFQFGSVEFKTYSKDILYFIRKAKGFPSYLVVMNNGAKTTGFDDIAETLTLVFDSKRQLKTPETFNLKEAPLGFNDGEIYVFEY